MSFHLNKENSPEFRHNNTNFGINGLNHFFESLEFHYFSKLSLSNYTIHDQGIDMALDMNCSIDLLDMLNHFNQNRWGKSTPLTASPLLKAFHILEQQNTACLDIEELTIFLNDTTITIKRIAERSIFEQFNNIINQLTNHHIYFTKGLTQKPYEIFVPVFEDDMDNLHLNKTNRAPKSYFNFWGIYMDTDEDALIYDLNSNSFIPADLDLSMQ